MIDSLKYLPSHEVIIDMINEVATSYEDFCFTPARRTLNKIILPVMGGDITYKFKNKEHYIRVRCFPFAEVLLVKDENSSSWSLAKGSKKSQRNASKMLDILFMGESDRNVYLHSLASRYRTPYKRDSHSP